MALTTFHERLFADDLLPGAIRSALELTDPKAVYVGRRPRMLKQAVEVSLTQLAPIDKGRGGAHQVTEHRYAVSVRVRSTEDSPGSGKGQLERVGPLLEGLRAALDGQRPFVDELLGVIASSKLELLEQDAAPDARGEIEGRALLSFFTRGSGALDGAAAPGG